jgi:hypothetical protein
MRRWAARWRDSEPKRSASKKLTARLTARLCPKKNQTSTALGLGRLLKREAIRGGSNQP